MKVVFFGRKDDCSHAAFLEICSEHEIAGIVECNATDSPQWRVRLLNLLGKFSLRGYALNRGIPYFNYSKKMKSSTLAAFLSNLIFDVGCVAVFSRLLGESVLRIPRCGFINIHPSLLPKYRGPLPDYRQYWNEDPDGGVTVHIIDKGEDTGPILAQIPIRVEHGRHVYDYTKECVVKGAREVSRILKGSYPFSSRPQQMETPFRARKLTDDDVIIDWSWPLERIYHVLAPALSMTEVFADFSFPWNLFSWTPERFEKKRQKGRITGTLRLNTPPVDSIRFEKGRAVLSLEDGDLFLKGKFRIGKLLR